MFVKKVRRKCSVRGCKNTDCFAISRTREIGNTVIICKSCLGNALASLDEINPDTKSNIPVNDAPAPALFYNAQALGLTEAVEENTDADEQTYDADVIDYGHHDNGTGVVLTPADNNADENNEPDSDVNTNSAFVCPDCGKPFESEKGLKTHQRYCKGQSKE